MENVEPQVDIDQLSLNLTELAKFSDCPEPPPAVTRVVFTPTDLKARDYLAGLYQKAGLDVRVDPIGNTYARWVGSDPSAPVIGTGSHTDAIPHAGMYDGTVGVLGGLEAIRSLQRAGFQPKRSIEVIMFTSEEPTRFGIGCTGSRMMSGKLEASDLYKLKDADEKNYDEVRTEAGFPGDLSDVKLAANYFHAFVELHIEQGPELEAKSLDIGIVTAIAAPATVHFEIVGEGGHAGGVLMPRRKDAFAAAAEIACQIESLALASKSKDLVATVGKMELHPGAVNSIPSRVQFTLDLRDIDGENRDEVLAQILSTASEIAERRGVDLKTETLNADPPAICADQVISAAQKASDQFGFQSQKMVSRAYHDSLFVACIAPTGMIFIPCRDGVSHRPDEFSTPDQIEAGVKTLAATLAELSLSD